MLQKKKQNLEKLDEKEIVPEKQEITLTQDEYNTLKSQAQIAQDAENRILRLQADFENIKKRLTRDKIEFIKYSNEQIIADIIPFIDDFQRAFEAADKTKDFDILHKGVEMILNHILEFLKSKGVSEIKAKGVKFNPAYHEAILQAETDEYPENTVVEELQKGYLLNDRVLRTAKVKVAKEKEQN
ncbi:MAG: nucleotide exchange factor GrpE [Candidatus Omnitrophota bacterium]